MQRLLNYRMVIASTLWVFLGISIIYGGTDKTSTQIEWTHEESVFIETHPVVRLGVDPQFVPFEFVDQQGQYQGITAQYLDVISKRTGIDFVIVPDLTWPQAYEAAVRREVDVLPAVSKTAEREKTFLFTKEYYYFKRVMVTKKNQDTIQDVDDLEGRTVAVQRNSSHHSYLIDNPNINLSLYDSVEVALTNVANGSEEVFLGNLATSNYLIRSTGLTDLRYIAFESEVPLSLHFAIRSDWPELVTIINKGLESISEQEKNDIYSQWIDVESTMDYGPWIRAIVLVVLLVFLVLAISSYWILKLQKEVKKRQEVQMELEKVSQVKSSFMARMSHEIRTPLNAIIGLSYILKSKDATTSQIIHLDRITQAANTMLGIVNDLLDFSKIEAGKIEIETISFSIETVIQNVINIISYKVKDKKVRLKIHKSANLPNWYLGDGKRIEQILLNLMNNAIKFTEVGYIILDVTSASEVENQNIQLTFTVEDSGIGMSEEQIQHLFQPFTQADASINRRYGGTGLGLSIVKNLAEMMHGTVSVKSQEGQGSSFMVTLPLQLDWEREQEYRDSIRKNHLEELNTLTITSDKELNMTVTNYLDSFGMNCQNMENLEDAILWIEHKNNFDLILLDYEVYGESVYSFVLKIRKNQSIFHQPKIIMIIPVMREDVFGHIEEYGIDIGIGKPLVPSVLFNGIIDLYGNEKSINIQKQTSPRLNFAYTVLLVEDNLTNQLIAKTLLEEVGYTVLIASNGQEAVEYIENKDKKFDLVLMDLHMPVMNGFDAAQNIRELDASIPVAAMTADVVEGIKDKCEACGMFEVIGKPFDPEKLAETVSQIIQRHQKILNVERAIQHLGGNKDLYKQVLHAFYEENQEFSQRLKSIVEREQYVEGKQLVHKIKGSLGSLGCEELYHLAQKLQKAFEESDKLQIRSLSKTMMTKMLQLMEEIRETL